MRYYCVIIFCLASCFLSAQSKPTEVLSKDTAKVNTQNKHSKRNAHKRAKGTPVVENNAPLVIAKVPCCCEEETSICSEMSDAVDTKTIAIDFRSKNIASKATIKSVRKGDYVRVKVMNYNPMQYKVVINETDSSVATPIDAKMLISFFDPTSLTSIVGTLIDKAGTVPITDKDIQPMLDIDGGLVADDGVTVRCDSFTRICPIRDCPKKRITGMNKKGQLVTIEVIDTAACLKRYYTQVSTMILLESDNIEDVKKQIEKKIYDAIRKFSVQNTLYPDCETFKNVVTTEILKTLEIEMEDFSDILDAGIVKMKTDLNDYAVAIASYKEYISKNSSLSVKDSLVKKFYAEALITLTKYRVDVGYEKLATLISKLEVLKLYSSCYVSLPIYVAENIKKINIELKSRIDSLGLPNYNTTLILPPIQHRVWGISSGVFVTGLKNEGYGVQSFTRPRTGGGVDTLYNIAVEEDGKAQIGANALAYTGWKLGKGDKPSYWGLCFGAGLSIESKPKPRVLFGGAYITGEKNRLMISVGFVGGYVKQLSTRFNTSTDYTQQPTDFVKDVLKLNGFLSINYSFLSN